ncbi:MAG: RNA 3'-terminal phosphate cyclase [Verrucomicrobiae bacterium]|nr:RNA 3'-terminal phosphate cyclase [Verrucomicrobiae bacterium]
MLEIDGSYGEGGGQILRSALTLSIVTGKPFKIVNIRARRENPGLQPQHLAAVNAAAQICMAETAGTQKGSQTLEFHPKNPVAGEYHFSTGTAGSATLVLQTILMPLILAGGESAIIIEGGTHNPMAPPYDFIAATYLPLINKLGAGVKIKLDRHGFYPAGGGKIRVVIKSTQFGGQLELTERGRLLSIRAVSVLANLPDHIAERELKILKRQLGLDHNKCEFHPVKAYSPGNVAMVFVEYSNLTTVFTSFGKLGLRAETVAHDLAKKVNNYLENEAPVDEHLADQLLLSMALANGGKFATCSLSEHTKTNIWLIQQFLPATIKSEPLNNRAFLISIEKK